MSEETAPNGGAAPAEPAPGMSRLPDFPYPQDPKEKRVKDWGMLPPSLMQSIEMARMHWTVANTDWMTEHGFSPHISGFKEALIRLGMKHINDPELGELIPPDRRRGANRRAADPQEDED